MRRSAVLLLACALWAGAGCGSGRSVGLLCRSCSTDSECGGNPCFADITGSRFCGAPCSKCPAGYSCQHVEGSGHQVVDSCFPVTEACVAPPPGPGADDMGTGPDPGGSPPEVDGGPPPTCNPPVGGTVTIHGGTVDRVFFGYTGDTRDDYKVTDPRVTSYTPSLQAVINNIYTQMGQRGVSFALDGGDHMEVSGPSGAKGNMASYAQAAALLGKGKPVFMTMGNHECLSSFDTRDCGYVGALQQDYKLSAFMDALQTVSGPTPTPYYRFDVQTQSGKAVFIVIADDAWNATQQDWLTQQLTDADATAKYTFVSKHHPYGNTDQPQFQQIYDLVRSHKYTLFLTGHSHEYRHRRADLRAVIMGLGGAPSDDPNQQFSGYLTAMQCPDDNIYVTVYDQATGNPYDTFSVAPQ
jgi:hypothetical protein